MELERMFLYLREELPMINQLAHVCLVVKDYDEAINWYTEKLGLELRSDQPFGEGHRWVTLGAKGAKGHKDTEIVLFQVDPRQQDSRLQQPGHVSGWVFRSDDCRRDVEVFKSRGVKIIDEAKEMPWGIQAIFEDLYGNSFVMVQLTESMEG
jgi:catechol 2,3-dioxygenase-like lactoylglutathione lyase family enzyme